MRAKLRSIIESRQWEYTIISIIALNAIILGLDTSMSLIANYGMILRFLDELILAIFVVELTLRIIAFGPSFFKGPWNLFDFFIISIALVPATGPATILRSLRILRILRLISVVPSLRSVIGGLILALPGMAPSFCSWASCSMSSPSWRHGYTAQCFRNGSAPSALRPIHCSRS